MWTAKHTEWRRIAALLQTSGQHKYDPAQDVQGTTWAQEREARRQGAVDRHAAWVTERQEAKDELRAQVWLRADVSRRLRAIAARAGLSAEQVLAQLAQRVQMHDDGTVAVEPFTPSRGEDKGR
ncbi:hypothetical protein ACH49O_41185 [Streptomyces coeruleorubidus]|uniref:hypothetical protein n=1 Tax=Streptomyces coeruleorubidus TaxID=116188 RepID=UPI0033D8F856